MSKPEKNISPLLRAQLFCKVGRNALTECEGMPDSVSRLEYAMSNLLQAVEEIATAMMAKGEA